MPNEPIQVKVKGVRQLQAGAIKLFANIEQAVANDAVRVTADQTAATVRSRVPRKTGRLAASVRAVQRGRVGQATMGAGVPYAAWIEYGAWGGRKGGGRGRYLYPTAKRTERAFRKHAEDATSGAIRGMHWPTPS